MKTREGNEFTETQRQCTKCGAWFDRVGSDTMRICKKCNSNRVKCMTPERRMYQRAKNRAKDQGLEFNLEHSDIVIPALCPVMGFKLEVHKGRSGGRRNSPALDRIDSNKGYIKGNVWVISHLANQMKSHATPCELETFARFILSNDWHQLAPDV